MTARERAAWALAKSFGVAADIWDHPHAEFLHERYRKHADAVLSAIRYSEMVAVVSAAKELLPDAAMEDMGCPNCAEIDSPLRCGQESCWDCRIHRNVTALTAALTTLETGEHND